jgi:murein DD-endopeptidase MepM/ murein hydrolase activator NlpD
MLTLLALLTGLPAWVWPLPPPPAITRPFQPPATAYGPGHRGVDLAGAVGVPVRAAGPGWVSVAGLLAGRGVVVVVHGSLRTTYEPVLATVHVGSVVAGGDMLGRLQAGHPGCPAAACLHWGLLRGPTYLDPLTLVGRGPVRLLPLDLTLPAQRRAGNGPPRDGRRRESPRSAAGSPAARAGDAGTTTLLVESGLAVGAGAALLRRTRRRKPSRGRSGALLGELPAELEDRLGVHLADP